MNIFGWDISTHRNYCARPFFFFEGRYFSGSVKVLHVGPLGVRFSRRRCDVKTKDTP
ncbi:MAG: hypothetical protein ACTS5I_10125 [Rhodanobacter sp.]